MELKPQALDRLMEALSPAFASELDRVAQETREQLEREFQDRLQIAVEEAESAGRTAEQATAASEVQRVTAEAAEAMEKAAADTEARTAEAARTAAASTREEVTRELEKQFQQRLVEATNQLKAEAEQERARLEDHLSQWQTFAEAPQQLGEASSQPEMLSRFMRLSQSFAAGLAIYTAKADGLALWKSRGATAFPDIISKATTDPDSFFRTISMRGKVVVGVCARPPFHQNALEFLSATLERSIEVFGMKLHTPVPKLAMAATAPGSGSSATTLIDTNADDQKSHAEARRTARLLVSEIKLYHEQELEAGRRSGDIYERLRKQIDLGRETYTHHVSSGVLASHDYFHEELVRILGENDAARLGSAYPGPVHP
jgi:hypothetical protein